MNCMNYLIPMIVIIISNVWGGEHGTPQHKKMTNYFGIIGAITLIIWFILLIFSFTAIKILMTISIFCLVTAISRDYQSLLKWVHIKPSDIKPFFMNLWKKNN